MSSNVRDAIRFAVRSIEDAGPESAVAAAEPVRAALAERGLGPNCHVGNGPVTGEEAVEWYAGQFLDLVDGRQWFAMNSFINCLDKFAPEKPADG